MIAWLPGVGAAGPGAGPGEAPVAAGPGAAGALTRSADPGLGEALSRLQPAVAAIEVGAHNPYGHPAPSTVVALRRAVPHVYRTDRDGTVRLTIDGGRMRIATHR